MHSRLLSDNPLRTREDLQKLVCDLTAPVVPHFSPGRAQILLAENRALYGDPAGLLEAYSRILWGIAPLAAGGGKFEHWDLWVQGLISGADPQHPEYWGKPGDYDQRSVEQAAFGLALALCPEKLWTPLNPQQHERLAAWLGNINAVKLVGNNWLFFRVLVNLALRRLGLAWSPEAVENDLRVLDTFYLGNGWYQDGPSGAPFRDGRTGDYYVPMAFHYYSLIYSRLESDRDPTRSARYAERARLFAQDFIHWFAADGSALPFGRSLCYRFAQGAFWGALAYAGIEAQPWPVIKGIYLRHLRWWMRQPIFSETGLLTIGYGYPSLYMQESYNSPGSPYWSFKTFLPLALPENHPFWRAEEAPLPTRKRVHVSPGAKLILQSSAKAAEVRAINPGQPVLDWPRSAAHKYSKCAYSTRFAFCVPAGTPTLGEGGLDSSLALSEDRRLFRVRDHCSDPEVTREAVAFSRWTPWPDVKVESWLLACERGHVRLHHLTTGRELHAADAGFAGTYKRRHELSRQKAPANTYVLQTASGWTALTDLSGNRKAEGIELGTNTHLLASLSSMPALVSKLSPGSHWLVCYVDGGAPDEPFEACPPFTLALKNEHPELSLAGELWWSHDGTPSGHSSPQRLQSLQLPV